MEHPDPNALLTTEWQPWQTPLLTLVRNDVDITAVKRLHIGVGDRGHPEPGSTAIVYIDDIMLTRSTTPADPNEN